MTHEVFISYAQNDKVVADKICETLEQRDVKCWIAPRNIEPGVPFGAAITKAIAASKILVLVLSSSANESRYVENEVALADNYNLKIFQFRVESTRPSGALEFYLTKLHWIDGSTPPIEDRLRELAAWVLSPLEKLPPL